MPTAAFAAVATFKVVFFRKYHITLFVEVKIFPFNQRLLDGFGRLRNHLK